MKRILIALGIFGLLVVILVVTVFLKVAGTINKATGHALYSSMGAWTRIQEFAHAQGKSNYVAEADRMVATLDDNLKAWRANASSSADIAALEKMRTAAYETTDRNIKNGQNPLAYLDAAGYGLQNGTPPQRGAQNPAGMRAFDYLACDGGPHLVLPKELSAQWKGVSVLGGITIAGDYARACKAVANQRMALISVGRGEAIVLADPPLSSWGHSPEGWIDIYDLQAWADTNIDAMIKRAVEATPTAAMRDTGKVMTLKSKGLILLYAGDRPGSTAYGEYAIPLEHGNYRILEGHYKPTPTEEVYLYRLQPMSPD